MRVGRLLAYSATFASASIQQSISSVPGLMCDCETETNTIDTIACLVDKLQLNDGSCSTFSIIENVTYTDIDSLCVKGQVVTLPWQSAIEFTDDIKAEISDDWVLANFSGEMAQKCVLEKVQYGDKDLTHGCQLAANAVDVPLEAVKLSAGATGILATVGSDYHISLWTANFVQFTFSADCALSANAVDFYMTSNYKWPKESDSRSLASGILLAVLCIMMLWN